MTPWAQLRALATGLWRSVTERLLYTPRPWLASDGGGQAVSPEYDALTALSTLARFPWVWTCVDTIAWDIAGLPLVAVRRTRTGSIDRPFRRELVEDPLLDRLERPNAVQDGVQILAQWIADDVLTGNGYIWFPDGSASVAIYRLHPEQVEPVVGFGGVPVAYRVTDRASGQVQIIPAEQVAHARGLSWRDDERAALGESVVRCLAEDLEGDLGARRQAARLAKKGRPDILFEVESGLGPKGEQEIREKWERAVSSLYGAFAFGGKIKATPLSWTPRDFGDKERDEILRTKVLAAFGVPPSKAGLSTASYGASRQETRVYWERQIARAARYARVLSRFARPGTAIEFDFSGVESLQVSNTERMTQAEKMVAMGATPKDAMSYVGFPDAPVPDERPADYSATMPIDRQPEEPQDDRERSVRAAVDAHLTAGRLTYDAAGPDTDARLLPTFLGRQLAHALEQAGLDGQAARWWGDEVAATTDEIVRAGGDPWTTERAAALVTRILTPYRAEAHA